MSEVKRFQWEPVGMRDVERVGFYRLSTWVDASDFDAKAAECERLRIEVDRLKAENAWLRADAERFIWLADRMARYAALVEVNPSDDDASDKNWFHIEQGEDLRVAIDAALSAGPLEQGHE